MDEPASPARRRWQRYAFAAAVVVLGLPLLPPALCEGTGFGRWRDGRCLDTTILALRTEALTNVEGIRTAQLAHFAAFDTWVDCRTPTPRPVAALDRRLVAWEGTTCWAELGWRPDGNVRGTYWTEAGEDGSGFTVHGLLDSDQNGIPAHAVADRAGGARWLDDEEF